MAERGITCLVTIHGMGFQVAPDTDNPDPRRRILYGYADPLHERLHHHLGSLLSDDPERAAHRTRPGEAGAIYVHSHWPVESYDVETGLARLGVWRTAQRDGEGAVVPPVDHPYLVDGNGQIAHIALVFAHDQNRPLQHLGSLADTTVRALLSHLRYGSPIDIGRMLVRDTRAIVNQTDVPCPGPADLRVRGRSDQAGPPGVWGVLRAIEEDVSTYVVHNDIREEVRGFVREALLRLAGRADVASIVVNAHSQGTVVAFDAVRSLPPLAAAKVRILITSGSPLRKYLDLFYWGNDVGSIGRVDDWTNFWDPKDPVADPLGPKRWKPGDDEVRANGATLFQSFDPDTATGLPYQVEDREVHNLTHSCGGGVRAHNYWGNDRQVVGPIALLLRGVVGQPTPPVPAPTRTSSLLAP
ncbi:MAG: hypothetical protein IT305_20570 [Chloroflexi bacterium]|nr:hypothetical protein [Chloroflexota bacterium]